MGLISGLGRSPGGGNGNPLQYSCLENPVVRGAERAVVHGVAKSQTGLSDWAHTTHSKCAHTAHASVPWSMQKDSALQILQICILITDCSRPGKGAESEKTWEALQCTLLAEPWHKKIPSLSKTKQQTLGKEENLISKTFNDSNVQFSTKKKKKKEITKHAKKQRCIAQSRGKTKNK